MTVFLKGNILIGQKRAFDQAYHPIVYISGPKKAPFAVILTHSTKFPCNMPLLNTYDGKQNKAQYFIAHFIEKMADWGPYKKIGKLQVKDLELIQDQIKDSIPMTWSQYEQYTKGKECSNHPKH